MYLVSIYRVIKTSFLSLWRNRWLSLAATFIMMLTIVIISVFASLLIITNKTTETLKDKVDMSVYFNETTTNDQINAIQNILVSRSDIESVNFVSKSEALKRWKSQNKGNAQLQNIISENNNPLPQSLEIKTKNPEDLSIIYNYLNGKDYKPLIRDISYQKNKNMIDRLVRITTFIKIVGYSLSVVFVLIAILIIYNTIRLTIFARSGEIDIMKLVGASDWYVRGPFIIEGISYGLIGSIIAAAVFSFVFKLSVPAAENYLGLSNMNSSYLGINMALVIFLQILIGILLGTFCSIIAVKKHLNEPQAA